MVARAVPPLTITNTSQIFWGRGLGSMWTDDVLKEISSKQNNIVVVTSGPTDLLNRFHDEITKAGAAMVVHMTWGRNPTINDGGMASFREQTVRIVDSARQFEQDTGVPVAPCGLVFYDLVADPPDVPGLRPDWVFMSENIHQGQIGTMANAATHYAVMTGRSPVGLPMWDPYPPELVKRRPGARMEDRAGLEGGQGGGQAGEAVTCATAGLSRRAGCVPKREIIVGTAGQAGRGTATTGLVTLPAPAPDRPRRWRPRSSPAPA